MSAQHTPGPWFIWQELAMQQEGRSPEYIDDELAFKPYHDVMAGTPFGPVRRGSIAGCKTIVTVDCDDAADDEESEAAQAERQEALGNARLIAAAPDLLAALQALEPLVGSVVIGLGRVWVEADGSETDFGKALDAARAAIAKATGGAL